jgi:peroxiredoxin Q/BCP
MAFIAIRLRPRRAPVGALLRRSCTPGTLAPMAGTPDSAAKGRLQPGDRAPDFTLPAADGSEVSLADYRGRKVVVYFYPAAMTPGCTTQACDFRDSLSSLDAAGFAVVGISPDKPAKLAKFRDAEGLTFPLLSDPDHDVLEAYGAWGEKQNYGRTYHGVIRSTVVVDEDGTVVSAQYNVRAQGHVAKLRRELGV